VPVPKQLTPIVVRYAEAILQNAAAGNVNAAEGSLDAAWTDLLRAKDSSASGNILLLLALKVSSLPGRTGDIFSVSLIEFVRSLLERENIELQAQACKVFADGLRGEVEKLPPQNFAASSVKLAFMGAEIVIALANGDYERAADMARFVDDASNLQFKYWAAVQRVPPAAADNELAALFRDRPDALEQYKEKSRDAWAKDDYVVVHRLSDVYLRLYPTSLGAAANKALTLLLLKKYSLALPAFDYAISLAPQDPFIWATWLQRAEAAWVLGKQNQVMESLMTVHKSNPLELKRVLTKDTPQGLAFEDFLKKIAEDPTQKLDARMLLRNYYHS
jgi:tetratricopeptide (TPR) repeat protein